VQHEIEVLPSPEAVARSAAEYVAGCAEATVARHGRFAFAVSGGHTPWAMFGQLAADDVPWEETVLYQAAPSQPHYLDITHPDRHHRRHAQ
jgi:6-phosphogluconolactonase